MLSPLSITSGQKREIFLSLCQSKTQTYHVGKIMLKSLLNISDIKCKHAELRSNAKSLNDQMKRNSPVTNSDYDYCRFTFAHVIPFSYYLPPL